VESGGAAAPTVQLWVRAGVLEDAPVPFTVTVSSTTVVGWVVAALAPRG
jgi:hypothetical protein